MYKKLLILAVVILVLIGGVILVWEKKNVQNASQNEVKTTENTDTSNVDTSNWKTYSNEQLKFSVRYPEKYALDTKPRANGFLVSFLGFDEMIKNLNGKATSGYYPLVSIYFWKEINDPDLKGGSWENEIKYKDINEFLGDSKHTNITKIGETIVAGQKAYVLSMPGEIGYEAIMFEGNGGFYRIAFPEIYKKIDDQTKRVFLSSFKFE